MLSRSYQTSSVYNQGLRIQRLCPDSYNFQKHLENLKNWFCKRGYPGVLIDEQFQRVKAQSRGELLRAKGIEKKILGIPFVVTYYPQLKNISKIIKKHIKHRYADPEFRYAFTSFPFVPFGSALNLKSHLVRSKLYPQERKIDSTKCNNSPCRLTGKNVKEWDTFTSHVTKKHLK